MGYDITINGTNGNYQFNTDDIIGCGGMGKVYRGFSFENNTQVAIKALHLDLSSKSEIVSRFETEARIRIKSKYVINIYDYIVHHNSFHIVSEYFAGKTLASYKTLSIYEKDILN